MNSKLLERLNLHPIFEPADLNGAGATGDYVCMAHYRRCIVLILAGDGTASKDIDIALYQATSSAGAGAKVLNALETGRIYTREGANFAALAAISHWTKETQATADEQWAPEDSGEQCLMWALEIRAEDLDADNGFDCIRADVSDPTASKIVAGVYIMGDPDYPSAPELMMGVTEEPGSGSVVA